MLVDVGAGGGRLGGVRVCIEAAGPLGDLAGALEEPEREGVFVRIEFLGLFFGGLGGADYILQRLHEVSDRDADGGGGCRAGKDERDGPAGAVLPGAEESGGDLGKATVDGRAEPAKDALQIVGAGEGMLGRKHGEHVVAAGVENVASVAGYDARGAV
jgi:hypothetical protein